MQTDVALTIRPCRRVAQDFLGKIVPAGSFLKAPREVARGQGGVVMKSKLRRRDGTAIDVAIKSCHPLDVAGNHLLLVEARLLLATSHPGILALTAVHIWKSSRLWLVTDFAPGGDLKTCLRAARQAGQRQLTAANPVPEADAVAAMLLLSNALTYLDGKGIVHGDVAARNVLVGASLRDVQLSDFGSAVPVALGVLGDKYSAGAAVPSRWMPPESLLEGTMSPKSDVWAFGVLCWEVCALGRTPYGVFGLHEVRKLIMGGERLRSPELGHPTLDVLAVRCWSLSPKDRPPAWQLAFDLKTALAVLEGRHSEPANTPHQPSAVNKTPAGRTSTATVAVFEPVVANPGFSLPSVVPEPPGSAAEPRAPHCSECQVQPEKNNKKGAGSVAASAPCHSDYHSDYTRTTRQKFKI